MTVALGLVCSDGALLAADSMGMQGRLASSIVKVRVLGSAPAAWTFAGSGFIAQEVEEALASLDQEWAAETHRHWYTPDVQEIKRDLADRLRPVIKDSYQSIATPPGERGGNHATEFMFTGWGNEGGYLIRLYADLAITTQVEPLAAIGFGHEYAAVASALMSHHLQVQPNLHQGKLLAHRTITTVCEVSAGGVGLPVQIATVGKDGACVLATSEVDAVSVAVDRWKELERESLEMQGDVVQQQAESDLPEFPQQNP